MRMLDGEPSIIKDLRDEGELIGEMTVSGVTVFTVRHPTLGRVVLVQAPDGRGVIVEVDE